MFVQNLGTAIFLVTATTIFTQTLVSDVALYAPSVSPHVVLEAGGSSGAIRSLVPPGSSELQGLLKAYSNGLNNVFFMLMGLSVVGFVGAWGMGWKNIRKGKGGKKEGDGSMEMVA